MALPHNRWKVRLLLWYFNLRIVGRKVEGSSCNCGAIKSGSGVAVEIDPAGDDYPGQERSWYLWSVNIREDTKNSGYQYSVGLSHFASRNEIEFLFNLVFPITREIDPKYQLGISGRERVQQKLKCAVRIRENSEQIRFCFDWGKDQSIAKRMVTIFLSGGDILVSSPLFQKVLETLAKLDPETYIGGPEPKLKFESRWRTDFQLALKDAGKTNRVFFQNIYGGSLRTEDVEGQWMLSL